MKLTRKQLEATRLLEDPEVTFILYGGAIRGAKTFWLIIIFFKLALLYPNSRWIIIRADLPRIKRNVLPAVYEVLKDPEFGPRMVSENKGLMTFTFDNESVVMLFSENFTTDKELDRFKGLEANGFGADEINELQQETLYKLFERAGSWLNAGYSVYGFKPRPIVLATCNPTKNWVKTEIYDKWIKGVLPKAWRYVQAKITDNPYVPKAVLVNLKSSMPYVLFMRFVAGDWEIDEKKGGEFIRNFDGNRHVKPTNYLPGQASHLSWDFNVMPYLTTLCAQLVMTDKKRWQVRFYDEICGVEPRNTMQANCREFVRTYQEGFPITPVFLYGDAQGNKRIEGLNYTRFSKVKEYLSAYSHNSWDRTLKANPEVIYAREFIDWLLSDESPVDIMIDPRCANLIYDLQHLKEGPNGYIVEYGTTANGAKFEKMGHLYDAFVYMLWNLFKDLYKKSAL